jgi:predicted alpha/beta-fold hydrolase
MRILLLILIRPIITYISWHLLKFIGVVGPKNRIGIALVLFVIWCAPHLRKHAWDRIISSLGRERKMFAKVKVGVHYQGAESVGGKIAIEANLNFAARAYTSPFLNGDWTTVLPELIRVVKPVRKPNQFRKLFNSTIDKDQTEVFATDWIFPKESEMPGGLCIFLAGIGGGSRSSYLLEVADSLLSQGWATCAINARGMKAKLPVKNSKNIFNPYSTEDLEVVLAWVKENVPAEVPILMVGFSLGAITLGKYMTSKGSSVPESLCGAIMVSGTFGMDISDGERYKNTYQKVIVPELVKDLLTAYGP